MRRLRVWVVAVAVLVPVIALPTTGNAASVKGATKQVKKSSARAGDPCLRPIRVNLGIVRATICVI